MNTAGALVKPNASLEIHQCSVPHSEAVLGIIFIPDTSFDGVSLLEFDRFGILLGEREEGQITSSGWPFVSAVLGQMAHLVTSITLNSARSCVMQSAFLTQRTVSNIPIVFSWSDSIRPEGYRVILSVVVVII
ncbi:hypothetical protein Tco_1275331 [Tanacetum coccineum]